MSRPPLPLAVLPAVCAAALTGCGATGASVAGGDAGGLGRYLKLPGAAASSVKLVADEEPLPGDRDDLKDAGKLDLAYANLRGGKSAGPAGRAAAEAAYERVLEDDPDNVDALLGLAWLTEQNAGDRPGELEDAERAYRRAATAAPDDPRPPIALGRFLAARQRWTESGKAFGTAVELAEAASDTEQTRTARWGLGVATANTGDIAGAKPHFVAALGEASAAYNVGLLHLKANDHAAAERELRQAVAMDTGENPELRRAHAALAALTARVPAAATIAKATPPPADPFAGADPFGDPPAAVTPVAAATPAARPAAVRPAASAWPVAAATPAVPATPTAAGDPPPWPFPTGG